MALIKYCPETNVWYRTARFFLSALPGASKRWRYPTLEDAVRDNPGVPVVNPETGSARSMELRPISPTKEMVFIVTDAEIRKSLDEEVEESNA